MTFFYIDNGVPSTAAGKRRKARSTVEPEEDNGFSMLEGGMDDDMDDDADDDDDDDPYKDEAPPEKSARQVEMTVITAAVPEQQDEERKDLQMNDSYFNDTPDSPFTPKRIEFDAEEEELADIESA
jgi:hypothetical protein